MVREGHYPKFSEMIDQIEKIASEYVKFESYLYSAKKMTHEDRQKVEDILAGKKTLEDLDSQGQSMANLPPMSNYKSSTNRAGSRLSDGNSDEKIKEESKEQIFLPNNTYDHDSNTTYHLS